MHDLIDFIDHATRKQQATVAMELITDKLANIIVTESNRIAEENPGKEIPDIYRMVVRTTLQYILPEISCSGRLWVLANIFKDHGKDEEQKPFNRKLEKLFREEASHILSLPRQHLVERKKRLDALEIEKKLKQLSSENASGNVSPEDPSSQENKPDTLLQDTMDLLLEQVREISEQNEKSAEKTYINQQIHHVNTAIRDTVSAYFNVFEKRETFGSAASPL
jgi:hypothetical protein